MPFRFIIKGLSATADGLGRESADRFASRNNRNGILCKSVSGERVNVSLSIGQQGLCRDCPDRIAARNNPNEFS